MQKLNEWYESSNSRTRNASAAWKNKTKKQQKKREENKCHCPSNHIQTAEDKETLIYN